MVKSYLKFEHAKSFGVVASGTSNLVWAVRGAGAGAGAGEAIVAANEQVHRWDIKTGALLAAWRDPKSTAAATSIARSRPDPDLFAVGYEDGSIRLWDSKISDTIVTFDGHRSAVTHLAFDRAGVRLASGSRDTDVIVWDLVAEVGQYKLRGHRDQITGLHFIEPPPRPPPPPQSEDGGEDQNGERGQDGDQHGDEPRDEGPQPEGFLLTTGKDSLIKLWDLSSRHCVETHVAQTNGECWALGVSPDGSGCVTAGNGGELQVWSLDTAAMTSASRDRAPGQAHVLQDRGILQRQSRDKATEVVFHPRRDYFAVHGAEKAVEIWRIRSDSEVRKSLARKRRRKREKAAAAAEKTKKDEGPADPANGVADGVADGVDDGTAEDLATADISDVFVRHVIVRTGGKVRGVDWALAGTKKEINLVVGTTNNQVEYYTVPSRDQSEKSAKADIPDYTRALSVELPGHRTDIRALSLSSDDQMLASASNGSLKIWNVKTGACIRTFACGYALCCSFLPGDKVVVVGTKPGELQLFDVASATVLETVAAHEGAVWSLHVHPDGRSVVSGSADKTAKFWAFKVVHETVPGTARTSARLKLVHARTLKVSDEILSLRFSPDGRLLATALLDSTVKVFFADSLKLYLNLYGHKLPVLSIDISFDSKLIITSSADKNIRIWGLDFGDCHRALFAHQDSILQVAFVPHNSDGNGHHFFSASKDRAVKYWDGDKFEQVQRLDGHHGEVWAMAVGRAGRLLVTAGHDKSIRVWEETDEQIFLEEERERELEELYESTLAASLDRDADAGVRDDGGEAAPATKQTTESLMAGERISEALELGMADLAALAGWAEEKKASPGAQPPQRSVVFLAHGGITAEQYVLSVLQGVRAAALQDALLTLPFAAMPALLTFLARFAARAMNVPLTCRLLFFVLRTHHRQMVASRAMRALLAEAGSSLRAALGQQKDEMGTNLAALRVMGMQIRESGVRQFVDGEEENEDGGGGGENGRKRAFVHVA